MSKQKIYVVGIGPGAYQEMTGAAVAALEQSDVIVGYTVYIDLVKEHFSDKAFLTTPMRKEVDRCVMAFEEAKRGQTVSMRSVKDIRMWKLRSFPGSLLPLEEPLCLEHL